MKPLSAMTMKLRRALLRRGRSKEDAEDLVQDAMERFSRNSHSKDIMAPEAYLMASAINLSINQHRAQQRSPFAAFDVSESTYFDPAPRPDEVLEARERLAWMSNGLSKLSPRSQRILLAQRLDGLTYAQIAVREGISVSAVEKHIARAMSFMLEWMDGW